jgi:ketosteroid isomerase-like protein
MTETSTPLSRWHAALAARDAAAIPELLAEDAVFRSPAVFAPQEGRPLVTAYLTAAMKVLGDGFRYDREWVGPDSAVLEFVTEVAGREVHGIDMITWNSAGLIESFTVMVRPMRALEALVGAMAAALADGAAATAPQ